MSVADGVRVYAMPALLFAGSVAGLVLALACDGPLEAAALALIAGPLAFVLRHLTRRRPASREAQRHHPSPRGDSDHA